MRRAILFLLVILVSLWIAHSADAALIAPPGTCHHARDATASHRAKRHALRCLIEYARSHAGRHHIAGNSRLHAATVDKGRMIARCGLSHTACGYPLGTWDRREGFCAHASSWRVGENLAQGYSTARSVVRAWLASAPHRANILGAWSSVGTAIRGPTWIIHFGRCGS